MFRTALKAVEVALSTFTKDHLPATPGTATLSWVASGGSTYGEEDAAMLRNLVKDGRIPTPWVAAMALALADIVEANPDAMDPEDDRPKGDEALEANLRAAGPEGWLDVVHAYGSKPSARDVWGDVAVWALGPVGVAPTVPAPPPRPGIEAYSLPQGSAPREYDIGARRPNPTWLVPGGAFKVFERLTEGSPLPPFGGIRVRPGLSREALVEALKAAKTVRELRTLLQPDSRKGNAARRRLAAMQAAVEARYPHGGAARDRAIRPLWREWGPTPTERVRSAVSIDVVVNGDVGSMATPRGVADRRHAAYVRRTRA